MKVIFNMTFILSIIISVGIGCLIIFEVLTFDQGLDYILKSLAVLILLGLSSAAITFVTNKNKPNE
jgi:branched-subunit amino acid ABC-type transport system permease component